jgi:hypothetical protein
VLLDLLLAVWQCLLGTLLLGKQALCLFGLEVATWLAMSSLQAVNQVARVLRLGASVLLVVTAPMAPAASC